MSLQWNWYMFSAIKLLSQLIVKYSFTRLITAPANKVSSRLNLSFQAEQPRITFLLETAICLHTADKFGKDPVISSEASLSNAICKSLVPLVVVSTSVLPSIKLRGYSAGEFPCC